MMITMEWIATYLPTFSAFLLHALLFVFFVSIAVSLLPRRPFSLRGKHALVTGGSKGIGKQVAVELIKAGCHVSIVARDEKSLRAAYEELQVLADERGDGQRVQWFSVDLGTSYNEVEACVRRAEAAHGQSVEILINNAGTSTQNAFEKLPVEVFEQQMRVNYLSAVYATRAVIEGMKTRKSGHISLVSSAAGQCAIWGYTAYAPTKFALRGFADALRMELEPFLVNICILFPPNTDTEGFAIENETMPEETRLLSEAAGLFSPHEVATQHVADIRRGALTTTVGFDGWLLGILTAGASAENTIPRAFTQVLFSGLLRGVILVYLGHFNRIIKKCLWRREKSKKK